MEKPLLNSFYLPIDLSVHGPRIDQLIYLMHGLMLVLFVGWSLFFIYCLIRFRSREGHKASHSTSYGKITKYLEVGVALFEAVLLIGLSLPIFSSYKHDMPDKKKAVEVRVVAEQFVWNVHYPGKDGVFGKASVKLVSASNPLGLDPNDAYGKDDFTTINLLHVPIGKPVIIRLSSKDVIHSFFIPVLRVKQDAIPGTEIPIWFEATGMGTYDIACAQLCGLGHYRMRGQVIIQTQEEFEKWKQEKEREQGV